MRLTATRVALVVGALLLASAGAGLGIPVHGAKPASSRLTVELDQTEAVLAPGENLSFQSTVRNASTQAQSGLIAHLNILSTDPDVYVDPEDWSTSRTQFLDNLPRGESIDLTWKVQAIDSGPLILYIAVSRPGSDSVAVSGPMQVTVSGRRVVNPGGVGPLVLAMPAGVLALLGLTLIRRRTRR